ncbi:hypothetical protein CspeluHIS016_0205060 [Cutaneotrichosporon spelunceum]|uniref:RING-type domain-containing protein n=1 Tax=Cutaneotrichosporon spelunceum TaxID=1672016 RepID=A0AAD3TS68_9TREE|nr:hypothetical protein CspeluHIS016_0205060 [Cutaneotrichosporon spelunceum]
MSHFSPRGMPILSGPPPVVESSLCRQCARDFSFFRRGHACGHCGYQYCSSCLSDGQALMPRREAPRSSGPFAELREAFRGSEQSTSGYDPESVCVHCLAMLQVTAAPLDLLRSLPLKRLKEYLGAYNIPTSGIIEKEGLVEAIVRARNPNTVPPPVPTILSLVALPKSYLATLSIGTLKAILYENHVRVDFKQVLEKEDLITRVAELVTDERRRLERQAREEEREAAEASAAASSAANEKTTPEAEEGEGSGEGDEEETKTPNPPMSPPTGSAPDMERGVCVVCQDEEATLAVVDCGHLAMCAHCSDLIMATSKECPLCRTRIITPQRLIRIYRV